MLEQPYVSFTVAADVLLVLAYVIAAGAKHKDRGRRTWKIVGLLMSVQGIVSGVRIVEAVWTSDATERFGSTATGYIILGGIVVICASFANIYDTFRRVLVDPDKSEESEPE